jgi:hypothetical protein
MLVKFIHGVATFLDIKTSLCYNEPDYAAKKESTI